MVHTSTYNVNDFVDRNFNIVEDGCLPFWRKELSAL